MNDAVEQRPFSPSQYTILDVPLIQRNVDSSYTRDWTSCVVLWCRLVGHPFRYVSWLNQSHGDHSSQLVVGLL
jgi:hypothetical protein